LKIYKEESQVEICQSRPREKQVNGVVDELDLDKLNNAQ